MVDCLILSHRPFLFRDIKINSQTFIALRIWSLIKQHPLVYLPGLHTLILFQCIVKNDSEVGTPNNYSVDMMVY